MRAPPAGAPSLPLTEATMPRKTAPVPLNRRTTRNEPPVLDEAVTAAECLTDDIDSQIEIASRLMGLPEEAVRPVVLGRASSRAAAPTAVRQVPAQRSGTRVVVVERRTRRLTR
jgi:hypothetical protein